MKELSPNLPLIVADAYRLKMVFNNIIKNASDAIRDNAGDSGATISIKSYLDNYNSQEVVRLDVTDSGIGMTQEQLQRVFDPFFTTKADGHGVGMTTIKGVVENHGGFIDISSKYRQGTTVSIFLPINPVSQDKSAADEG